MRGREARRAVVRSCIVIASPSTTDSIARRKDYWLLEEWLRDSASLAIGDARCVSVIGGIGESGERRYGQLGAER